MGCLRLIRNALEKRGLFVRRFDPRQVIPAHIPDIRSYRRPEDLSLMYRAWLDEGFDRDLTPEVTANSMLSRMKLYYLRQLLMQALPVDGDVFEAGSGSGGSARLMLDLLRHAGARKTMWLVDTFEGYRNIDPARDGGHVAQSQCKCASDEHVRNLLSNADIPVHVIKGAIPGALDAVRCDRIAFAHIDVNLYQPTKAATAFCLERISPGGVILFDDYAWPATYGARQAIEEVCGQAGENLISLGEQAFLIRRGTPRGTA